MVYKMVIYRLGHFGPSFAKDASIHNDAYVIFVTFD